MIYELLIIVVLLLLFGHLAFSALNELSSAVHHLSNLRDSVADLKNTSDEILEALERIDTRDFRAKTSEL